VLVSNNQIIFNLKKEAAMDMNQNLGNLMKEAQKMQQRMQEAQDQLTQLVVEGKSGGKMVTISMNGRHDVTNVKISRALQNEDIEMLEDLVAAAVNDAVRQIEKASKEKISQLTAGLNIPTDFMKSSEDEDKS
jgi:DNA-binding YbaB/EbfC family protein